MEERRKHAGGCFLTIAILLGFAGGLATGNPLRGTLIGVGVGAAIAVAVWLIDVSRNRS